MSACATSRTAKAADPIKGARLDPIKGARLDILYQRGQARYLVRQSLQIIEPGPFTSEDLLAVTRTGGDRALATKIQTISGQDLVELAFELGVTDRRKIGLTKAKEGIRRRIQESLLLSGRQGSIP